jgi:RHS repeat-associated protein
MHLFRSSLKFWLAVSLSSLGLLGLSPPARGAEQVVVLNGVSMTLQDVTSESAVYYTSMRLNRALNIWNVEATVSNKSVQTFTAPLVLVVDSAPGTSGLLQPGGFAGVSPVVDLSRKLTQNTLLPGQISAPQTLSFGVSTGTPSLATRVFALPALATNLAVGFVRTLDQAGQPLGSVAVEETGPAGQQTNQTDAAYGAATLGEGPGQYTWKFGAPGFLPVWRRQTLDTNGVALIVYPRLTSRSTNAVAVTPLEGVVISNATVAIAFASGSVNSNQTATLTPLTQQTLPALLPPGWSPLQAFWLEMPGPASSPPNATLQLWGPLNQGETGALVVWNSQAFEWDVLQLVTSLGGSVISTTLPGAGAYAFVVGDSAPATPPAPQVNQPLGPSTAPLPNTTALAVSGQVAPSSSPASLDPDLVTGTAAITVALTNGAGGLASGLLLECDVQEQYQLISGTAPVTPAYANFIVGYQRPGTNATNTLQAGFPIRPLRLFGPAQLSQASVSVGVMTPGPFGGVLLTTNGGQMVSGDAQLLAGTGEIGRPQAMLVTSLNPTNFVNLATNLVFLRAFDLTVTGLLPGNSLALQLGNGPTNALLVVALVLSGQGVTGLEPVARLASDGQGRITSLETNATDNLPGINGSGLYVLLQVTQAQALVKGIALNTQGQPAGGLVASLGPWTTLSRAPDGQFLLIAPAGDNELSVSNLATGDTGQRELPITAGQTEVTPTLGTATAGLEVVSTSPTNNAANVPQVTSITVDFSQPLNPATLTTNTVQLLEGGQLVPLSLSLDTAGTTATILPNTQLDAATNFTLVLATNVTDTTGRPLQGQTQFTFSTVPLSTRDPAAQLIIYAPGATNLDTNVLADLPGYVPGTNASQVVVHGSPGVADPGVPVVVVNEGSGVTTTVISKSDGSFTTFVIGQETDFISATFVGLNGSRLYVPVNRQLFDDGSVGLYPSGGSLQATGDGGPVQVTVPPNAIQGRAKFKLASVNVPELQAQLGGVTPTNATVAGGALNLNIQGSMPTLPMQVSFPVDLSQLGYPTNQAPTNAAAALAVVETNQDFTTFQVVDQLLFQPQSSASGQVTSKGRPTGSKGRPALPKGRPVPKGGSNDELTSGIMDTGTGLVLGLLPGGQVAQQLFNCLLVPLLFGSQPVVIKGKVGAVPIEFGIALEKLGQFSSVLNLQTSDPNADTIINAAMQAGIIQNRLAGAGQVVSLAVAALQQLETAISAPIGGAFLSLQLSGGPLVAQPGHLFPGMVYCTSGSDGTYLMVAPAAGANYLVDCTHPLFTDVLQEPVNPINYNPFYGQGELSLSGVVYHSFLFTTPLLSAVLPTVNIAFSPEQPAAGSTCQVLVSAFEPPPLPTVAVSVGLLAVGTTNLITGLPEPTAFGVLTNTVAVTNGQYVQWSGTLFVNKPVTAALKIFVAGPSADQNFGPVFITNRFSGPALAIPNPQIPAPDTNDVRGPIVIQTDPVANGYVGQNSTITVIFNKPIDSSVTTNLSGIVLSPTPSPAAPVLHLSPDQQTLTLEYPGLLANQSYALTLSGLSIRDLAVPPHPLNQVPSSPQAQSFTLNFRTPPSASIALPDFATGTDAGRGSAIVRNRLYVLDQGSEDNDLLTYDITTPLHPVLLSSTHLYGQPRDLVVIPQYRYATDPRALFQTPPAIYTNDLVVVVGGDLDAVISQEGQGASSQDTTVSVPGQYLWVMNMADPDNPQILASPIVSYEVGEAVTKVRWAPPYVVFQEMGADLQRIGLVNLQELLIGYGATAVERDTFPPGGNPGLDVNNNGEYVDPGDKLPLPDVSPPEFYGLVQNYVLQGTTQNILDFSVTPGGGIVGITLQAGEQVNVVNGNNVLVGPLGPSYRTLCFNTPLNFSDPTDAAYYFGATAYPRWVTVLDQLQIPVNNKPTQLAVALVSLQPDTNGIQTLAVLNITLPEQPQLLNKIQIPDALLGGAMEAVTLRTDGKLEVAGQQNVVLLDPAFLAVTNVAAGQLHPAIVDVIPAAGGVTRSLGASDFGVYAVADNGRAEVVQTAPQLQFVSFPLYGSLVDPSTLHLQGYSTLTNVIGNMSPGSGALAPARFLSRTNLNLPSDLEPPNPALHFYVLAIVPGGSVGANQTIDLGLESLNPAGNPLSNLGVGFAPVRAVSTNAQQAIGQTALPCGAPIRSLTAYRVTDDPISPFYNYYLSRPFALITEAIQLPDLARVKGDGGPDREILFSGYALRAFIDPSEHLDSIVGPFTAQIDPIRKALYPIAVVSAPTVNRSYITGDNPPPNGGSSPMEDSYGTIQAHSGEVRTSDPDFSLPSPRMPINIIRSIGNQDTYVGPFGVGWDFNYNQRLTILDPLTFPAGLQMPLVERDSLADSEIAGSQDVLFTTGGGQVYHFIWQGTNMPSVYASDPLVQDFDYKDLVSDYYLPEHGMFNLLVKFKDGRFERLTPGGERYRYRSDGRLETILDRYPINRHDLTYDPNDSDKLVRIDDNSVPGPRYLLFGYYRRQGTDPSFTPGLDIDTDNSILVGKICRIQDYASPPRDVIFQYSADGFLTNRMGIQVNGENGGYAGRSQTYYTYQNCLLVGISASQSATPVISAVTTPSPSGKPVATASTGSKGNNQYSIAINNSAKTVSKQTSGVQLADGTSNQRQFDKMGNLTAMTVTGTNGATAMEVQSNSVDGLVLYVVHAEGNSETMTYDTNNPVFRSRANLLSTTVDPGPRGGQGYTVTNNYDARYNLQSGTQLDPNGFLITFTLTPDSRDVQTIDYAGFGTKTATYNANGQLTQSVDENGVQNTVAYDPSTGFMTSETRGSVTTTYSYDGSVASQLGRPASISPALGTPTVLLYNNHTQPVETDRGEFITQSAYDELGRPTYHLEQVGGGKQWTETRMYDDKGFITNTVKSGIEVNGVETSISTTYIPDARSRIGTIIHPNGTLQTFAYDNRGNISQMMLGDYSEQYGHDLNNNLISLTQGGDLVRVLQYDGLDRTTNVVRKTGTQDYLAASTFYRGGQMQSYTVTDPVLGVVRQVTYDGIDALGRHTNVTVHGKVISPQYQYSYGPLSSGIAGPRMSSTTVWDAAGNQTSYTDPDVTTTIKRDANGRPIETDNQEDGATYSVFVGYDDMDTQNKLGDLLGTKVNYVARADGNYLQVINARGNVTALTHTSIGELLSKQRADGMEVDYRHDVERQTIYEGDPSAGFNFGFDADLRMTNSTLRNGASVGYGGFDPRSMPTAIAMPGGTQTLQYDLQRQLLQRKISYQSTTWEEDYAYDALGRAVTNTYIQNGGPHDTSTFTFDPAGPITQAKYHEDGSDFVVGYGYYSDGLRQSITYPSGVTVTETRDATGRLTGLSDANGNIISASSWHGNSEPAVVQLGGTMRIVNTYDARGRLTGSRVTRPSDGAVLAHMRYQYDPVNNLQVRQFIHRGGRADVFGFDAGERVAQAQIGVLVTNLAASGPPLYLRQYTYDPTGLDYLTAALLGGPLTNAPLFATNWTDHDAFLLPSTVDAYPRGAADPMGNVLQALLWVRPAGAGAPQAVPAALQHDGRGHLFQVALTNGLTLENHYQAGGMRFARKTFQSGQLIAYSGYVYDGSGRLLEEYDRTGAQPALIGRYYYASGDSPVAADLLDPGSGQLRRYYYLRDAAMSVIAVADQGGNVVERAWYDTYGQPWLEQRDASPPVVNAIAAGADGSLLISMSEPVLPAWADPGVGGGVVVLPNNLQNAFTLQGGGIASVSLVSAPAGAPPLSVLQFTPSQVVTGTVAFSLSAGVLSDEWGNTNAARSFTLTNLGAPAGTVFYSAANQASTGPVLLTRSSVGSPFLFQGQYFDYDAGLFYLRARFYDPYSGMFFEPDPLGYEDSVNHYAGLANNPASLRDPSGLRIKGATDRMYFAHLRSCGYKEPVLRLIERIHPTLSAMGMTDLEIAAHVRVMHRELTENNAKWEISIRKFGEPHKVEARIARMDEFHQGKPEKVVSKTDEQTGLVLHEKTGEVFASDLDGLYAKRNGQIASLEDLRAFQGAVNDEVAKLTQGWRKLAEAGGQEIHGHEVQKAYQHGFSLNLPQEYGMAHELSPGGTFGQHAWGMIEEKMKAGTKEAFAFKLDNVNQGIEFTEHVNVNAAIAEHEDYYHSVVFNPAAGQAGGFNAALYSQRQRQFRMDGFEPEKMFPSTFYGHSYGEGMK